MREQGVRWGAWLFWPLFFLLTDGRIHREVEKLPQFFTRFSLSTVSLPSFLSERAKRELDAIAIEKSFLDEEFVPLVVKRLRELPWVEEVSRVERNFPAKLVLQLKIRLPVARVKLFGQEFVVDQEGIPVPCKYYRHVEKLPKLWGVQKLEDLRHGAYLAKKASTRLGEHSQALRIDLSNLFGRKSKKEAEIVFHFGEMTVEWGKSPLSDFTYLPEEKKWRALRRILSLNKAFRRVRLPFVVDHMIPVEEK